MNMLREAIRSTRGRIILAALAAICAWQVWLSLAAPGKIAPGIDSEKRRVDVLVTLPFPPERFHIQKFQKFGRISGTKGNSVQLRGVNRAVLQALARPFWVKQVEPLATGGEGS